MAFIIGGTLGAIVGTSALGGIGSAVSSGIQSAAAGSAADKQARAAADANKLQYDMFQQQRQDQEPWRQAGAQALTGLGNADFQRDFTMADFQKDPGYDFRMQEGMKALDRSAAARGALGSGGSLKGIARYGQDFASNEFNNAYNRFNSDRDRRFSRLSSIAGVGQAANNAMGAAGQNYANQAGSNITSAGQSAANADLAAGQAWGNTLSNVSQMPMQGYWMNRWMK